MKKTIHTMLVLLVFALFTFSNSQAQTQFGNAINDSLSALSLPIGYTRIGDQDYFGLRIQPQLRFGKLGFGLNIPILFKVNRDNQQSDVRNEEYESGTGSFRLLSYLRYGMKDKDKLFLRFGALDQLRLGQGLLVNNFSNGTSFERRKVGLLFDVRPVDLIGVEGFYSDFNGFNNLVAIRPYVRPFANSLSDVTSSIQFGVSFLRDADKNRFDSTGKRQDTRIVKDGVTAVSIDGGITVAKSETVELRLYGQYAMLNKSQALEDSVKAYLQVLSDAEITPTGAIADGYKAGSGFSIGAEAKFKIAEEKFDLQIRLERLFYSEHFLPQFFDALYEIDKDAKLFQLANAPQIQGSYGSMTLTFFEKLKITGALQIPDKVTNETPALIQFNASANDFPIKGLTLSGNYLKGNLGNLADAFSLDERSLLTAGIRYQLLSIFMVGADYRWTFARIEEDGINKFKATTYVTPYFGLYIPLGKNNKE